jgi:hypothetical protein
MSEAMRPGKIENEKKIELQEFFPQTGRDKMCSTLRDCPSGLI